MSHAVIAGSTECGKTTLARALCEQNKGAGIATLVCDPYCHEWGATWQTRDMAAFLAKAKASRRCALFIDEGGQTIARDKDYEWLFTGARHWGHKTHVMCHGGTQLLPVMRAQCSTLFLFRVDIDEAALWAKAMVAPELPRLAPTLAQYEFLCVRRFQPVRRCKLSVRTT